MASLPVVNQPAHRVGALIDHLARRLRLRSETVLEPLGLRPRHLLALTLVRDRDGISQQTLASTLEMDGTNVVGLLNDLEREQLVERRRSPEDRRRHTVSLTEAGAKTLAKAEFALAAVEDEVFCALDGDQRETLYRLLQTASNGEQPICTETIPDC
ncbi:MULTISPECIES: MarR family winged helix-turn-helix transcriptional regulator [Amycolatopsis]|uniref:MarR family winged helix-turn-helix transcriptional regulator n=1 Tax=Amycolatopsis tucumanensis TaxID=401106 RepID=A0ABP7JM58_9PSEU|nr:MULTISPECIES: MarR family winged helix-turn-helix transcriptional regulator [Amycolatopsis]MCF6424559.1 MarR family winged helix-turn-helix transcriptional regulator [Amycolatopsis tucumanensis]